MVSNWETWYYLNLNKGLLIIGSKVQVLVGAPFFCLDFVRLSVGFDPLKADDW